MIDLPLSLPITKIQKESDVHSTFFFKKVFDIKPGQFIMMWLPDQDEKPFAVSYLDNKEMGITIEKKGAFTKKIFELKIGDKLGIRGPYGNGFYFNKIYKRVCIVSGGTGVASVALLVELLKKKKVDLTVIHGSRTKELLLYLGRFKDVDFCTDDGSYVRKGYTSDVLEEKIKEKKFDVVYTCGPEIMMKKVYDLCEKYEIKCQASLERFMRCGFGICAACVCGRFRVCKDGPIFHSDQLRTIEDFGKKALLKTGKEANLNEYHSWRSK